MKVDKFQEFLDANREKYEGAENRVDMEDFLCDYKRLGNVRALPYDRLVRAYFGRVKDLPENQLIPGWKNPRAGLWAFVVDNPHVTSADVAGMYDVSVGVIRGMRAYLTMQRNADLERDVASQQDEEWSQALDWAMFPEEYWAQVGMNEPNAEEFYPEAA